MRELSEYDGTIMSPASDKPKAPALTDLLDSDFMARLDRLDILSRTFYFRI